jgi:OOP family OmpA-OmpF porin
MFYNSSGRKIFIGVVTSTLLSTAINSVLAANEKQTNHLLDSEGKPVFTQFNECVQTPTTPNDPPKPFKECGDIGDRDGDGVPDDEDQCPDNTAEEISKGVYDDKNPPRGPNNKPPQRPCDKIGCPIDTDGDGVADYGDDCPDTTADYVVSAPACTRHDCVNERGCVADSDNDGIIDCLDKCPNTPPEARPVDGEGCSVTIDTKRSGTFAASSLFDFDKAALKPEGKQALNELAAKILGGDTTLEKVEVIGHTDPVGKDAYNQKLSEKRAKAVYDYLISQGVPAEKISSEGRGESQLLPQEPGEAKKSWHARCRRVEVNSYVKQ